MPLSPSLSRALPALDRAFSLSPAYPPAPSLSRLRCSRRSCRSLLRLRLRLLFSDLELFRRLNPSSPLRLLRFSLLPATLSSSHPSSSFNILSVLSVSAGGPLLVPAREVGAVAYIELPVLLAVSSSPYPPLELVRRLCSLSSSRPSRSRSLRDEPAAGALVTLSPLLPLLFLRLSPESRPLLPLSLRPVNAAFHMFLGGDGRSCCPSRMVFCCVYNVDVAHNAVQ